MIHQVFFWLRDGYTQQDIELLTTGIKTLAAIETVRSLHVGVPASTEKREVVDNSFQVAETIFFDNEVDQKSYQDHAIHEAFVKKYSHLWQKVIVYDIKEQHTT